MSTKDSIIACFVLGPGALAVWLVIDSLAYALFGVCL